MEYIDHAVAAGYVRLQGERYSLRVDLTKTNGIKSFPQRPIPLNATDKVRSYVTQKMNSQRAKELIKNRLESLNERLENGSIGPWQYKEEITEILNGG